MGMMGNCPMMNGDLSMMGNATLNGLMGSGSLLLLALLLWLAVLALLAWGLARMFATRANGLQPAADEMLAQRFARGEVGQDEFERARQALR